MEYQTWARGGPGKFESDAAQDFVNGEEGCGQMEDGELIERIGRAQAHVVRGDLDMAREIYAELWEETTRSGDTYGACVAAHFAAHAQVEPEAQLDWHTRSLDFAEAAKAAGDERVMQFFPSLHANLADVFLRLGDRGRAQAHIEEAWAAEYVLQDDAYGQSVRTLIARLSGAIERDRAAGG